MVTLRARQNEPKGLNQLSTLVCCVLLLAALTACTASVRGQPERLFPVATEAELARALAGPEVYTEYARGNDSRRRELRDQIVFARMYAADIYYSEYEAQLTRERQDIGFLSTVAQLALTSTATAVASKEAKTILAAVATGLTGAKEAYDKEILIERTIAILQQQMRTRRKEIKVKILGRLALSAGSYPLELALTDIESYYRAGTITGALIDVSEETGARLAEVRAIEESVVVTKFAPPTDLGARIRAYARSSSANKKKVADWIAKLKERGIDVDPVTFMGPNFKDQQREMIGDLKIQ